MGTATAKISEMSDTKKLLAAIAIMTAGFTGMGGMGSMNSLLQNFAAFYSDVSFTTVSFIGTLPMLFVIPFAITGGYVVERIGFRPLLLIAECVVLVFGVLPAFSSSLAFVLVCRALVGLGAGIILALCPAYILRLYDDNPKRQSTMVGFYGAADALGGVFMAMVVGILAVSSPFNGFWAYGIAAAGLILVFFFCPEIADKGARKAEVAEEASKPKDPDAGKIPASYWVLAVCTFFAVLFACSFTMTSSVAVAQFGLGDVTVAASINAAYNAGGFFIGIVLGFLIRKLKSALMPVSLGLLALCLAGLIVFHNSGFVVAAFAFMISFTQQAFQFGAQAFFPKIMDTAAYAKASGIFTAIFCFAGFFASIWTGILSSAFNTDSVIIYYQVGAVLAMVLVVVSALWAYRISKKLGE